MNKRIVVALCKYLLAFGLLGYVIRDQWKPESPNGLKAVWDKHVVQGQPIQWQFLLLGTAIYAVCVLLTLMRWYLLVRAQDIPFKVSDALRLGMIGIFFSAFLPGSVGGDVMRAAFLAREQKDRRTVAVATVLMDRAIALWGLIWFVALLGGTFWAAGMLEGSAAGPAKFIVQTAGIIVAVTGTIWFALGFLPTRRAEIFAGRLSRVPKIGGSLAELWRAVWMYRLRPKAIALTMVLSWIGHVGFVTSFYCFSLTLWDGSPANPIPSLTQHFLIVPIGLVIAATPLFPGGAGIGELGYEKLYEWFGCKGREGVLASVVKRVIDLVFGLVGLVVYLRSRSGILKVEKPITAAIPAVVPSGPSAGGIMTGEAHWGTVPVGNAQVG